MDHSIAYTRWKLNKTERNYLTIEWECLGMLFCLQKCHDYLSAMSFIFYKDHQSLKYFVNKQLHNGRIHWGLLLFQEFKFEVVISLGKVNVALDHLSRIETGEEPIGIDNDLPNTHTFKVEETPKELADIVQFLQDNQAPSRLHKRKNKILATKAIPYTLMRRYFYMWRNGDILRLCDLEHEQLSIREESHFGPIGRHFHVDTIATM